MKAERIIQNWRNSAPAEARWSDVKKVLEFKGFEIRSSGKHHVAIRRYVRITIGSHFRSIEGNVAGDAIRDILKHI